MTVQGHTPNMYIYIYIYIYGKNGNYTLSIPNIGIYSSYLDGTYYLLNFFVKYLGHGMMGHSNKSIGWSSRLKNDEICQ